MDVSPDGITVSEDLSSLACKLDYHVTKEAHPFNSKYLCPALDCSTTARDWGAPLNFLCRSQ